MANQPWLGGYSFRPFGVKTTNVEFEYSAAVSSRLTQGDNTSSPDIKLKGTNVSAVWIAPSSSSGPSGLHLSQQGKLWHGGAYGEALVNGRLQGYKEGDVRGASVLSRKKLSQAVLDVLALSPATFPKVSTYIDLKRSDMLEDRRAVKKDVTNMALQGWPPNTEDNHDFAVCFSPS